MRTLAVLALISMSLTAAEPVSPPVAKKVPKQFDQHGEGRIDNYFWLRDLKDPDTIPYLEAENKYTDFVMKGTDKLQSALYSEILSHIKETDDSVPVRRGEFYYYLRTEKGKQYPIHCRKKAGPGRAWNPEADEEVLIDSNRLAEGQKYFRLGNFSVSPDHKMIAFATETKGDEVYTLYVKNLASGKLLSDKVENTYYGLEWGNDNKTLFYTTLDPAKRPYRVFRHTLGSTKDELVYEEKDERFAIEIQKSRSRKFVFINIGSAMTSEVRYLDADAPASPAKVILPRVQGIQYEADHGGGRFYIQTRDGAPNFRVVSAPVTDPSTANWKEVLPAREGIAVESVLCFKDHLVVIERHQGLHKIRVQSYKDDAAHYVEFEEPAYAVQAMAGVESDSPLRFNYSSMVTPASVYDYDMALRKRELKKRTEVPNYDPAQYVTERIFATAPDGVKVPVSLVYRKGFVQNGKAPAYLYAYGSYGIPTDPGFAATRLPLLDRGFVCAIAHIRGGGDLGKTWHDDGKLLKKRNTFTDFIAAAQLLVDAKYTSPDRLAIRGGSAGGLLMGAVTNMRPDLFRAVIANVPFVDVINTMSDATLPLTVGEYEEWGNPGDKTFYDYIRSYSPYENVDGSKTYPWILATGGLNDPRVSYWEPAKWTATMRASRKDRNPLLLKIEMNSGHGGSSGRYEQMKEIAFEWSFILLAMGISQ